MSILKQVVFEEQLNDWDSEFITHVIRDIEGIQNINPINRVLIFPPFNNRRRYLIHKVCEKFHIYSFSIGDPDCRFFIVCPSLKRNQRMEDLMDKCNKNKGAVSKTKKFLRPDAPIYIPPAVRKTNLMSTTVDTKIEANRSTTKKILNKSKEKCNNTKISQHIIQHLSNSLTLDELKINSFVNEQIDNAQKESPHLDNKSEVKIIATEINGEDSYINEQISDSVEKKSELIVPEIIVIPKKQIISETNFIEKNINSQSVVEIKINTEPHQIESQVNKPSFEINKADHDDSKHILWETKEITKINDDTLIKDNDQDQEELLRASEEINRKNKRIIKQSFNNSDILIISENDNNEIKTKVVNFENKQDCDTEPDPLADSWEDLIDENLVLEIQQKIGQVNIDTAKEDYSDFKETTALEGDFAHVLEAYDFPKEFHTRDLVSILDSYKKDSYNIKWIDDAHALIVLSSGFAAQELLKNSHPLIKLRPFCEASKQSKSKALRFPNAFLPCIARPQTCPQTARRVISGALGIKLNNAKEERAKEMKILNEAREKRRLHKKQQDDAWEGKPSSN